ncbi:neuropeptide-like protein C4orf48 homolog [Hyla sarda]|uniref:neuropeptide-like protein C4orf48 homolog n=1 Tax=Hyla sarda TaxID=327740 RepID=UPI0024C23C19|nr:neuropeptide-like protein C4orf48 homolog [Hyla sarda]
MMLQFAVRPVIWWLVVEVMVAGTSLVTTTHDKVEGVNSETGSIISADTRLCVDCHTFEFMERAVQDLYKAAYSLDSQTNTLFLRTEDRGLCRCSV